MVSGVGIYGSKGGRVIFLRFFKLDYKSFCFVV